MKTQAQRHYNYCRIDTGKHPLISEAYLSGDLVPDCYRYSQSGKRTEGRKPLLRLIAVNSSKWEEAPDNGMRAYFLLLHEGLTAVKNPKFAKKVDFNDHVNKGIYSTLAGACGMSMLERINNKGGNKKMEVLVKKFITEAEEAAAEARGKAEGITQGIAQGVAQGIAQGMSKGAAKLAELIKSGMSVDEALAIIHNENSNTAAL